MKRSKYVDDRQMGLFEEKLERFAEVTREILTESGQWRAMGSTGRDAGAYGPTDHKIDTEDELYVEIAAACKNAIRESGKSREQVLDLVNAYLKRKDRQAGKPIPQEGQEAEAKRAVSIHIFNNFLSKPTTCRLPLVIVHAICRVTGNFTPYQMLVGDLGGQVVTREDLLRESAVGVSVGADLGVCPDLGAHTGAPLPSARDTTEESHGRAVPIRIPRPEPGNEKRDDRLESLSHQKAGAKKARQRGLHHMPSQEMLEFWKECAAGGMKALAIAGKTLERWGSSGDFRAASISKYLKKWRDEGGQDARPTDAPVEAAS